MKEINRKILVTGASGYVGGRLVRALLGKNLDVRVFVRDKKKLERQPWKSSVEVIEGNANNHDETLAALKDVHTAYYLLHSINYSTRFDEIEAEMARTFATAAAEAGVKQIIYLGGIANDRKRSKHLESRANTGRQLANGSVPVMELRAGIIIGSGSASFEMLRHLTHRLPIMTTPKWVSNKTHPIAIRDILYYLTEAARLEKSVSGVFDVGGPEVVSYEDMMQIFAKISGLRRRIIIKVPVLSPKLSSLWIGLVTPVPTTLARPLVGSLISEVVADPEKVSIRLFQSLKRAYCHCAKQSNLLFRKHQEMTLKRDGLMPLGQLLHGRRRRAIPHGLVKLCITIRANSLRMPLANLCGKQLKVLAGIQDGMAQVFSGFCADYLIA
jgi:uncharacterized protein YbjT (DUF2867 family)